MKRNEENARSVKYHKDYLSDRNECSFFKTRRIFPLHACFRMLRKDHSKILKVVRIPGVNILDCGKRIHLRFESIIFWLLYLIR